MGASTGVVFGGGLWPIGQAVGLVEADLATVVRGYEDWTAGWEERPTFGELRTAPILEQLEQLLPLQMPYKRRLLVGTTAGWTAIFDNSRGGGDPFPAVSQLSSTAGVRGIVASHTPAEQHPFPATQLHLFGPEGEPPLLYVRTIDAGVFESGRWTFRTCGPVQPFEEPELYERRRIRDRFDRDVLLRYLEVLGLTPDDSAFYTSGVLVEDGGAWRPGWSASLAEARAEATAHVRRPV